MNDRLDLEALRQSHEANLIAFACKLCGNLNDAEDLVQQVWEKALQTDSSPQTGKERAWLLTTLKNLWHDRWRYSQRRPVTVFNDLVDCRSSDGFSPPEPGLSRESLPEHHCIQQERSWSLKECLDGLEDRAKQLLIHYFFQGYSYAEIGNEFSVAQGTVASGISRAKERIRDCMQRKGWS